MSDDPIENWLAGSDWQGWTRQPLAGDASSRRYERLCHPSDGQTAVLMIAPPETCGPQDRFVDIARHLRALGLTAPKVFSYDPALGLMVLEDLGKQDFASWLRQRPDDETRLYSAAVDCLSVLSGAAAPPNLIRLDPDTAAQMLDPFFDWYVPECPPDLQTGIKTEIQQLFENHTMAPECLSLRDFHAENLIWRPDKEGLARVGLLDFQDAFLADPAYDLVSLLRDARRDVSPETTAAMTTRCAQATNREPKALGTAFAILSVQRNLRILGIFARLAKQADKPGYLSLIPRVLGHVRTDLDHPTLSHMQALVREALE